VKAGALPTAHESANRSGRFSWRLIYLPGLIKFQFKRAVNDRQARDSTEIPLSVVGFSLRLAPWPEFFQKLTQRRKDGM
jgi:hypothetical protein